MLFTKMTCGFLLLFSCSLGVYHDSGVCATGGYIMNEVLSSGSNAFRWSPCSRKTLEASFSDRLEVAFRFILFIHNVLIET